jgi:hypothetical protein
MNNKKQPNQLPSLTNETNVHKVFVFILKKLDLIYSSLSNEQTLKQKNNYIFYSNEQTLFIEIQKLLDKLIKISKKQKKEPKQQSFPKLDNKDDLMKSDLAKSHFNENSIKPFDSNDFNIDNNIQYHHHLNQSVYGSGNQNHDYFPNEQRPLIPSEQQQSCALNKQSTKMLLANKEITALLELRNKMILLGSKDGFLTALKVEIVNNKSSFKKIATQPISKEPISHMCIIDSIKIAASSLDGKVYICYITESNITVQAKVQAHKGFARMVILLNNYTCLSCGSDGYVYKIDLLSSKLEPICKEDSEITSIFKLNKSRQDIVITSCLDSFSLGFWNYIRKTKEASIPKVHSFYPNGIIELPEEKIIVANYSEPISLCLIDIRRKQIVCRIEDKKYIKATTSLYLQGNNIYCISNKSFCQISLSSFKIENKLIDPEIKPRAGLIMVENGKYILIPNSKNGINVYTFNN